MLRCSLLFFILLLLSSTIGSVAIRKANLRAALSDPNQIENCQKKEEDVPVLQAKTCKGTDEYIADILYALGSNVLYENNFFENLVENTSDSPNLDNYCVEADDCLRKSIHWLRVGECPNTSEIVGDSDDANASVSSTDSLEI